MTKKEKPSSTLFPQAGDTFTKKVILKVLGRGVTGKKNYFKQIWF